MRGVICMKNCLSCINVNSYYDYDKHKTVNYCNKHKCHLTENELKKNFFCHVDSDKEPTSQDICFFDPSS